MTWEYRLQRLGFLSFIAIVLAAAFGFLGDRARIVMSLVSLDMTMTYLKKSFPAFDRLLEGSPVLLVREGKLQHAALRANGLDEEDLREAARLSHGLDDMEDVRQATLERDGEISIVPWRHQRQ